MLFPIIRALVVGDRPPGFRAGGIERAMANLVGEHDRTGELLEHLRALSVGYTVPADGCASYAALYRALEALAADTHLHVHIENNRLFPMVLALGGADSVRPADRPQ